MTSTRGPVRRSLLTAGWRLTDRDRRILRLLYDHLVLTTSQLQAAEFESYTRAEKVLRRLRGLGVIDGFRPPIRPGSAPYHWCLTTAGSQLLVIEDDEHDGWSARSIVSLLGSQRLSHHLGVNSFFTSLMEVARREPSCSLSLWESERACKRRWGAVVRPDGYGVWREGPRRVPFLLEYDVGTEELSRLRAKLTDYAHLLPVMTHLTWVLFVLPTARREEAARRALAGTSLAVATAVLSPGVTPAAAVWLPIDRSGARLRLAELPDAGDSMAMQERGERAA